MRASAANPRPLVDAPAGEAGPAGRRGARADPRVGRSLHVCRESQGPVLKVPHSQQEGRSRGAGTGPHCRSPFARVQARAGIDQQRFTPGCTDQQDWMYRRVRHQYGHRRVLVIEAVAAAEDDFEHLPTPMYFKHAGLVQGQGFENVGEETLFWYAPWPEQLSNGVRVASWQRDRLGYFQASDLNLKNRGMHLYQLR